MDGAENTIGVERGDTAALPPLALPYPLFFSGSFLLIAEWARRSTPPFRAGRAQVEFDTMAGGAAGSGLIPTFAVPRHRGDVEFSARDTLPNCIDIWSTIARHVVARRLGWPRHTIAAADPTQTAPSRRSCGRIPAPAG